MNAVRMQQIQDEHAVWAEENFPDSTYEMMLEGMVEELGEWARARLKRKQGIRGSQEEWVEKELDAIGDFWIYGLHVMTKINVRVEYIIRGASQFLPVAGDHYELFLRHASFLGFLYSVGTSRPGRTMNLSKLWAATHSYCKAQGYDAADEIVQQVWDTVVKKRNWVFDPELGRKVLQELPHG